MMRVFLHCLLAYIFLVFILRLTGNRTLSQMNSFDFVITVAMGSTFSATILQKSVPLSEGLLALFLLVAFQYVITKLAVHSKLVDKIIKSEPRLLFRNGEFLRESMKKVRVNEDEILSAMREQGISTISQVEAAIMESNGKISVVAKQISHEKTIDSEKTYH